MGTLGKGLLRIRWQTQIQFVRNKSHVNVTRPRPPHFDRALLERMCLPSLPKKKIPSHVPDYDKCDGHIIKPRPELDHPLINILVKESLNNIKSSKMVALFHLNSMDEDEKFQCELTLKKAGMKLKLLSKFIMERALKGTMYEAIIKLTYAPTMAAFSPESDINKLLKLHKKLPKLLLMGAIVDNKLLSLSELHTYSKIKDITEARLMLVSTLNSASQRLVQQINHHPSDLVRLLNERKKNIEGS